MTNATFAPVELLDFCSSRSLLSAGSPPEYLTQGSPAAIVWPPQSADEP
ncbi:hypothetical protein [Actinomadura kijaniata]|nr:hypothetical protein [Actinomadura kijaniata]